MTRSSWKDGAVVELRKSSELFIDDRFMTITACHCRLEIVWNNRNWSSAKVMHSILASSNKIFLLLGPHCLAICHVATWKNCHKGFSSLNLTCEFVYYLKLVSCKVNVHLITSKVLNMSNGLHLKLIMTDSSFEASMAISIWIFASILFIKRFDSYALTTKSLQIVW